jgi:hypothetical protein
VFYLDFGAQNKFQHWYPKSYLLWFAEFAVAVTSVCCTAKQPPNGPATALLRQRTVQTFPVEAVYN